jgi:hypothetical protein
MVVYKVVDEFSNTTGKKIGSKKVFDFFICDFTGEKIDEYSNPNTYDINYLSKDPCFGDGIGEEWLSKWNEDIDAYDLFSHRSYIFTISQDGAEIFGEMVKKALSEMKGEIYSLDELLRWSRGNMLEKVLKKGTYKIEQFLET